jgi:hypothetical protein
MSPRIQKCLSFLKLHGLTLATFGGVILGVILGVLLRLRPDPWTPREVIVRDVSNFQKLYNQIYVLSFLTGHVCEIHRNPLPPDAEGYHHTSGHSIFDCSCRQSQS